MSQTADPILSALLITPDTGARLHETLRHLAAQTVCRQIELVLLYPPGAQLGLTAAELEPFHSVRHVELGAGFTSGSAFAAGALAAQAPIVVSCEDHSYPQPGWAEALLAAHDDGWAAVGPAVRNGNPQKLVSWADMFVCFGEWIEPASSGVREHIPQHNSSYRRELLVSLQPRLPDFYAAEGLLQDTLRRQGHRSYLEAAAIIAHTNFVSLPIWMVKQYHAGQNFGAHRSQNWTRRRRWLYVAGGPLIPLVQWRRVWQKVRRCGRYPVRAIPLALLIFCGLAAHAAGEMTGYAFGLGTSEQKLSRFELGLIARV